MIWNCFDVVPFGKHEISIFFEPSESYEGVLCSKQPGDIQHVRPLLHADPNLWIIFILRDPRNSIVSRHGRDEQRFWASLKLWKKYLNAARPMMQHARFVTVRYEDLTENPQVTQDELQQRMSFLNRKCDFIDYHRNAIPSSDTIDALGGLRPIQHADRNKWHEYLSRVKGQMQLHGGIGEELIELGYEMDRDWESRLQDVEPDLTPSVLDDQMQRRSGFRMQLGIQRRQLLYRIGMSKKVPLGA